MAKAKNWAKHYATVRNQQQQRPAENASRVLPAVLWDQYPDGRLPAPEEPAQAPEGDAEESTQ